MRDTVIWGLSSRKITTGFRFPLLRNNLIKNSQSDLWQQFEVKNIFEN